MRKKMRIDSCSQPYSRSNTFELVIKHCCTIHCSSYARCSTLPPVSSTCVMWIYTSVEKAAEDNCTNFTIADSATVVGKLEDIFTD